MKFGEEEIYSDNSLKIEGSFNNTPKFLKYLKKLPHDIKRNILWIVLDLLNATPFLGCFEFTQSLPSEYALAKVAFSPKDNSILFSCYPNDSFGSLKNNSDALLFDLNSEKILCRYQCQNSIKFMAFSNDGKSIIIVTTDSRTKEIFLHYFNAITGDKLQESMLIKGYPLLLIPNGKKIIIERKGSDSQNGIFQTNYYLIDTYFERICESVEFSLKTENLDEILLDISFSQDINNPIPVFEFSLNSKIIIITDVKIRYCTYGFILDGESGEIIKSYNHYMMCSNDASSFATIESNQLAILDENLIEKFNIFRMYNNRILSLEYSPDNSLLLVTFNSDTLSSKPTKFQVWNAITSEYLFTRKCDHFPKFDSESQFIYVTSKRNENEKIILFLTAKTGVLVKSINLFPKSRIVPCPYSTILYIGRKTEGDISQLISRRKLNSNYIFNREFNTNDPIWKVFVKVYRLLYLKKKENRIKGNEMNSFFSDDDEVSEEKEYEIYDDDEDIMKSLISSKRGKTYINDDREEKASRIGIFLLFCLNIFSIILFIFISTKCVMSVIYFDYSQYLEMLLSRLIISLMKGVFSMVSYVNT